MVALKKGFDEAGTWPGSAEVEILKYSGLACRLDEFLPRGFTTIIQYSTGFN
jgi:hypothetical protein